MRRILEVIGLAALALLLEETLRALYGADPLRGLIPTHFTIAGQPDAWGSPHMLWLIPGIACVLYLLMTWVSRHPGAFNFPVRVTPFNRGRLEVLALSMIAWLQVDVVCFFALLQWSIIRAARNPGRGFDALPMPAFLGVIFL